MFELGITVHFDAAHCLPEYPGKCSRLHGHNWKIEVLVTGSRLNKQGMLVDFRDLKEAVNYLQTHFKWKKNETSLKFVSLIKRRFPNE